MGNRRLEIKSLNINLPEPIAFNCWKHHLGFIKSFVINQSQPDYDYNKEIFQFIGDSLIDLYIGNFDCKSISFQVLNHNDLLGNTSLQQYKIWLNTEGQAYKIIYLDDGSSWTLRFGNEKNRHIHIHPSRHSINTIRVHGSTLKTAIAFFVHFGVSNSEITVEKVNIARMSLTDLPPIKPNSSLAGVIRIINLLVD